MEIRHLPGQHDQADHGSPKGARVNVGGTGDASNPIRTGDMDYAARLLAEGRNVDIVHPDGPSVVLSKLKDAVDRAKERGPDAGPIDLCKMTLRGTNVFCAGSLGIPRPRMPQLGGVPEPGSIADRMPKAANGEVDLVTGFMDHLSRRGITSTETTMKASELRPSQSEINGAKVAGMARAAAAGKLPPGSIVVTSDGYVVDGHHRFAVKVADELDGRDGVLNVVRIDAPITKVLAIANNYTTSMGLLHRDLAGNVIRSRGGTMSTEPPCIGCGEPELRDEDGRPIEVRSYSFEYEIRSDTPDGLTLEGYASTYGEPARVADFRGVYDETIERGADTKTLREKRPHLLVEHGRHPLFGRLPAGVLTKASEDTKGLHVLGRMSSSWMFEPVVEAIRSRAIGGMSVEQIVLQDRWGKGRQTRSVLERKLPEVSIVLDPVYAGTELSLRSLRSLDRIVHDDPEIRAIIEAASGTSTRSAGYDEPLTHSDEVVPESTMRALARTIARRYRQG